MSLLTEEEVDSMRLVVEEVYKLPYSLEFREPVYISYPELLETYLDSISNPMDLGTVLLKLDRGQYTCTEECAKDVCLVFDNAIAFNPDLVNLVANARALLQFATALWVEVVNKPFRQSDNDDFLNKRIALRKQRLEFVWTIPLCSHYLENVGQCLREYKRSGAIGERHLGDMIQLCSPDSNSSEIVTLAKLASFIFDSFNTDGNGTGAAVNGKLPCFLDVFSSTHQSELIGMLESANDKDMVLLNLIDDLFGEVSAYLAEKATRGYFVSAIWARPHGIVWAQPNKSPWWPAMILAGEGVPAALSKSNISRIPPGISQALMKLKPKTKDDGKKKSGDIQDGSTIPPGLCLMEYFGTHDFGWIRFEKTFPYSENGLLSIPAELKGGSGPDKVTPDTNALNEAKEAYPYVHCKGSVVELVDKEELDMGQILEDLENKIDAVSVQIASHMNSKRDAQQAKSKAKSSTVASIKKSSNKKDSKDVSSVAIIADPLVESYDRVGIVDMEEANSFEFDVSFKESLKKLGVDVSSLNKKQLAVIKTKLYGQQLQQLRSCTGGTQLIKTLHGEPKDGDESFTKPMFGNAEGQDFEDKSSPNTGDSSRGLKRRRRRIINSADEFVMTASQAGMSAFHGCSVLARHRRRGKYFTCPTMHPREVDFNAPLFNLEGKSCEFRKALLKSEIIRLKESLDEIRKVMETNGKSVDYDATKKQSKTGEGSKARRARSQKIVETVMVGRKDSGSMGENGSDNDFEDTDNKVAGDNTKRSLQISDESERNGENTKKRRRVGNKSETADSAVVVDTPYHHISASSMMPF